MFDDETIILNAHFQLYGCLVVESDYKYWMTVGSVQGKLCLSPLVTAGVQKKMFSKYKQIANHQ